MPWLPLSLLLSLTSVLSAPSMLMRRRRLRAEARSTFVTKPDNKVSRLLKSLLRQMREVRGRLGDGWVGELASDRLRERLTGWMMALGSSDMAAWCPGQYRYCALYCRD